MFYGLQLHFVCLGPFARQDIFTLDVAVNHDNGCGVIIQITDDHRHGGKPRKLAGVFAPVAGNKLITAVRAGANNSGNQYAVFLDALHGFFHGIIVPHLKRMVGERVQL